MKPALFMAALAATLFIVPSHAQQLRRCYVNGHVVYQEDRCPDKVIPEERSALRYPVPGPGGAPEPRQTSQNPIEAGKELCRQEAPKRLRWKDPGSLQVGEPFGGKTEVAQISGVSVAVRVFYVPVNGKNSYGGYTR